MLYSEVYMPVKFKVKQYISGGVYHIYNKGIDGREVFSDDEDYRLFLKLLEKYLAPVKEENNNMYKGKRPYLKRHQKAMNLNNLVELWSYCLLPNHFHLLVRQNTEDGITKLMRRVVTMYVMAYNKKYSRRGTLFENAYRAIIIPNYEHILYMTKYIHLNPVARSVKRFGLVETVATSQSEEYLYSSYHNYVNEQKEEWINPLPVLEIYKEWSHGSKQPYRMFMEDGKISPITILGNEILE